MESKTSKFVTVSLPVTHPDLGDRCTEDNPIIAGRGSGVRVIPVILETP
jgi:hypothetical protein